MTKTRFISKCRLDPNFLLAYLCRRMMLSRTEPISPFLIQTCVVPHPAGQKWQKPSWNPCVDLFLVLRSNHAWRTLLYDIFSSVLSLVKFGSTSGGIKVGWKQLTRKKITQIVKQSNNNETKGGCVNCVAIESAGKGRRSPVTRPRVHLNIGGGWGSIGGPHIFFTHPVKERIAYRVREKQKRNSLYALRYKS